uniref:Uncharacterized protein n=1 Tax=Branchiostoma floridae TaxID=7739 RepID=C3ZKD9_BRAFL|eukprot:XP_002591027.1 hypothetical protein BRAFLDRAFT_119080 [Branchiostoma floridae]
MYPNTKFNRTFLGDFFYVPPKDAKSPPDHPQPKGDLRRSKYEVQVLPAGPPQDAPFMQQADFRKLRPSYEKELAIRNSLNKFGRKFTGDPGYKGRGVQPAKTQLPDVPKKPPPPQKPKRKTSYPSLDFKTLPELYQENLRKKEHQRKQQEKEERQKKRQEKKRDSADDVIRLPQLAHAALQKMHDINKQRRSLPGSESGLKLVEARHSGAWRPPAQVYTPPWPHHIPYKDGDPLIPFEAMYPTPEFVKKERREKARTHVPYPHNQSWRPPADVRTPPWPHKVPEDKRITCPREFQHYVQYHMMPGLYSADSGMRPKVRKVKPKKVRVERPDIWSFDSQRFVYRSMHPALQI